MKSSEGAQEAPTMSGVEASRHAPGPAAEQQKTTSKTSKENPPSGHVTRLQALYLALFEHSISSFASMSLDRQVLLDRFLVLLRFLFDARAVCGTKRRSAAVERTGEDDKNSHLAPTLEPKEHAEAHTRDAESERDLVAAWVVGCLARGVDED